MVNAEPREWLEFRGLTADGTGFVEGARVKASEHGVTVVHTASAARSPESARRLAAILIEAADHAVACGCVEAF